MNQMRRVRRWILLLIVSASAMAGAAGWQMHAASVAPTVHVLAGGGDPPGPNSPTP